MDIVDIALFYKTGYINTGVKMGNIANRYTYIANNRETAMSTLSKTQPNRSETDDKKKLPGTRGNNGFPDPRFRSQKFRQAVRTVLEYLGMKATFSNFREVDSSTDWFVLPNGKHRPLDWWKFATEIDAANEAARIQAGGEPIKHGYTPQVWMKIKEIIKKEN